MSDTRPVLTNKPKTAIHYVKCHPPYFKLVREGVKPFELRLNDRDYRVGDHFVMHEWDPEAVTARDAEGYTGREIRGDVTCVVKDVKGLEPGYAVLGVLWRAGVLPTPRGA